MTITRTAARIALVGVAALSFAACSSSSSDKSDAKKLDNEVRAAATKADKEAAKAAKAAETTSTTAAPAPACPTIEEATAALGAGNRAFTTPMCEQNFAAGDASNEVDFAYILQADSDGWVRASNAVQSEICTTNPQGLSQQFVNQGCDD